MGETEIIDVLLRFGRKRAKSDGVAASDSAAEDRPQAPVRRREAQFSDADAVFSLKERSGLSKDSLENWIRLWQENPARKMGAAGWPMGWVQEADGKIVGYLGSIPLLYQYGERTILAAATTSYAVDPAYRSRSLGLVGSFFRQPNCDLYLDTTATPSAAKVMRAFKAEPLPQRNYESVLFWVLSTDDFLAAALKKLQLSGYPAAVLRTIGSRALRADIALRSRKPKSVTSRLSCRELSMAEVGDDFRSLWERKLRERPRLLAWRTPEVLHWHFRFPDARRSAQMLACYEQGILVGYAVVLTGGTRLAMQRSIVADVFVDGDRADVIRELLAGAFELGKVNGSAVLEVMGFPEQVRSLCRLAKPFVRKYPACPFFYKTDRSDLQNVLKDESSWYAGPYDGDTTLYG